MHVEAVIFFNPPPPTTTTTTTTTTLCSVPESAEVSIRDVAYMVARAAGLPDERVNARMRAKDAACALRFVLLAAGEEGKESLGL